MSASLPSVRPFSGEPSLSRKSALICAEGFEDRSLAFLSSLKHFSFSEILVLTYLPEKKSRLSELLAFSERHTDAAPEIFSFHRFLPATFEAEIFDRISEISAEVEELVVDISVMSKLIILILLVSLKKFRGRLRIIYSEPANYKPTEEEYLLNRINLRSATTLPSWGVHDVVRTPSLTSVIMQRSPTVAVAFSSFNEQLIRALLSNLNPTHLFLINGVPPVMNWRATAMQEIHSEIIKEYSADNPLDMDGRLTRRASTLFYSETFDILAEIYRQFGVNHRIVIAPTGSKMQAVACAFIKLCCSDIHIEYPTPESFLLEGYSSRELKAIHELIVEDPATFFPNLANAEALNE